MKEVEQHYKAKHQFVGKRTIDVDTTLVRSSWPLFRVQAVRSRTSPMIDVAFGNGSSGVLVDPVINNTVAIEDDATWLLRHCEELLSMNPIREGAYYQCT